MKIAKLLHNPKAGNEEHDKKELIELIRSQGFDCRYASTKEKDWDDFETDTEFIIVAGGDGTVRKVTKKLLDKKVLEDLYPIALLPMGTANNIGNTLNISGEPADIIKSWHKQNIKKFDIGKLVGVNGDLFFVESFGYGLFPYLMKEMEKIGEESKDTPEKKLETALKVLHKISLSYEAADCKLEIDGVDHSGKYLMAEIMNTKSIGPNLMLSPNGDPGDGELEVVTVSEEEKEGFASYVLSKLNGTEVPYSFNTIKAKKVDISWGGTHVHVDDKVVKISRDAQVQVELKVGLLEFFVP